MMQRNLLREGDVKYVVPDVPSSGKITGCSFGYHVLGWMEGLSLTLTGALDRTHPKNFFLGYHLIDDYFRSAYRLWTGKDDLCKVTTCQIDEK